MHTEHNTYIYDHETYIKSLPHGSTELNPDDSKKEITFPLRRITLKNGLKKPGELGIWLAGKITVEGYVVAHELSHAAAYLECFRFNINWTDHKEDSLAAILHQCKIDDNKQNREFCRAFLQMLKKLEMLFLVKSLKIYVFLENVIFLKK